MKGISTRRHRRGVLAIGLAVVIGITSGCVTEMGTPKTEYRPHDAAKARVAVGLHYLAKGDRVQARYNLERALTHAPDSPDVHNGLAWYFRVVQEPQRAEAAYLEALKHVPDDPSTLNNYGSFLCEYGRYAEAEQRFNQAIDHPNYIRTADVLENAGRCALTDNRPADAENYLSQALQYDPNRAMALLGLAEAQMVQAKFLTARGYLARYNEQHDDSAYSLYLQGRLAIAEHRTDFAKSLAAKMQAEYPDAEETEALVASLNKLSKY